MSRGRWSGAPPSPLEGLEVHVVPIDTQAPARVSKENIRSILNEIIDPCSVAAGLPAGLIDMGLLLDLQLDHGIAGCRVQVVLGTTDGRCLVTGIFMKEAEERIGRLPGVISVDVTLDASVIWTSARHSAAYRERLAAKRATRRGVSPRAQPMTPDGEHNSPQALSEPQVPNEQGCEN